MSEANPKTERFIQALLEERARHKKRQREIYADVAAAGLDKSTVGMLVRERLDKARVKP